MPAQHDWRVQLAHQLSQVGFERPAPPDLEPQAALVQNLVDRVSLRPKERLAEIKARLTVRLRGKLTIYDTSGNVIRSTHEIQVRASANEFGAALQMGRRKSWLGRAPQCSCHGRSWG